MLTFLIFSGSGNVQYILLYENILDICVVKNYILAVYIKLALLKYGC